MRAALIGMPFSGKTLLFQALTGVEPAKREENLANIKVPDERIDYLADVFSPDKKTYAEFIVMDFTVEGAKSEVIPAKVKNLVQKMDMLILVVRDFDSVLTDSPRDPLGEYRKLRDELILTDLMVVEKRLEREAKEHKNPPDLPVLKRLHARFESNQLPAEDEITPQEHGFIANYSFLTLKKRLVLVNRPEGENDVPKALDQLLEAEGVKRFAVSATLEKELNDIPLAERQAFLEGFGMTGTARERLVTTAYASMNLISFLTVGEDEVRAWPIRRGSTALEAAGKIHTDIARGFIRAETVPFEVFKKHGSEDACKAANAYKLVGKDYVVQDGDLMEFRFNI